MSYFKQQIFICIVPFHYTKTKFVCKGESIFIKLKAIDVSSDTILYLFEHQNENYWMNSKMLKRHFKFLQFKNEGN